MSNSKVDEVLAHYGVVGMKWGRRKATDESSGTSRKEAKKIAKADAKWERKSSQSYMKVYNQAADRMNNGGIEKFNNNSKYKDKDLSKDRKLEKEYFSEYSKLMTNMLNDIAKTEGVNPSGTKRLKFEYDVESDPMPRASIIEVDVKHDGIGVNTRVETKFSDLGQIISIRFIDENLISHGEQFIEALLANDDLAHYGVPGMKWGRRKASSSEYKSSRSVRRTPESADHKRSREIGKKKVSQMSNAELREITTRMQLEKQFKDLNAPTVKKGKSAIDKVLESSEKANKLVKAYNSPVGKFVRRTVRNAAYSAAGFDPPRSSADRIRWAIEDGSYAY
ncbi:hypothetical protein FDH65_gp07 [Arthrobacter phage Circum]|uniref:Uncharacterized protein n=1 Tax=Arthrobacter phage Circum TaxID=1772295 RepID=A0A0U4ID24_9CAUD|nr:hypothetical protein FDH65_gp07 [Arthrobacter phage Circum]ALY08694.1 hypothetical protein CIRCUM_7 [Arthrobacter phage Circum]